MVKFKKFLIAYYILWALTAGGVVFAQNDSAVNLKDSSEDVEKKIDELLKKMTIEEKAGQCNQSGFGPYEKYIRSKTGLGHLVLQWNGGITSGQSAVRINQLQKIALEETRLGIPLLVGCDGITDARVDDATTFPQEIAIGSTWNPELVRHVYSVIGREMRAVGYGRTFSPNAGIARDPRFGRTGETFGEDTYLVTCMTVAAVKGLYGESLRTGIIATPKHFVAYDATTGGKDSSAMDISEKTLREVWLPSFRAAVKAGAGAVMCAYHAINGIPCAGSKFLLTDILKQEWDFDGFIVTDFMCVKSLWNGQHVTNSFDDAIKLGFESGIDVYDHDTDDDFAARLARLVEEGRFSESILNEACRRTLRAKFRLGLFDNPYVDPNKACEIVGCEEHRKTALQVARESLVLLKNEGNLLPLKKNIGSIAVIGPNADNIKNQLGTWTKMVVPAYESGIVTILKGIKNKVSPQTKIYYEKGCGIMPDDKVGISPPEFSEGNIEKAVEAARKSDLAIVVVGDGPELNAEQNDRANLDLTGLQNELIKAVYQTQTPTVVVLINQRPLTINYIAENIPVILEAWNPGEEGGNAVADVLFGDYNPGGKLPVTFPRSTGQLPVYYNYEPGWHGGRYACGTPNTPLYPFGFGLSYTTFEYNNLHLSSSTISPYQKVDIMVDVKNTGRCSGDEVVQLYINDPVASRVRPVKELKGFQRISLEPGETRAVKFTITPDSLAFYNREMKWVVEPGLYNIMIGGNSIDFKTISLQVEER